MLTYKELSSSKASQVEDIHALAVAERYRKRYDNAFTTFYDLDEEQIKLFSNMIGRYVKFGKILKSSQHPIASALNEYARYEASKINGGNFLNIGGNPNKEKGLHFCNLINDCRNEARLKGCKNCCFKGAQNCDFKSDVGVAVDSLYDVPFEDIHQIFEVHGLQTLHAWMFLPLELIDEEVAKIPNPLFRLKNMDAANSKVSFSFVNDFSSVYVHNKVNWAKYLINTAIIGDGFCIDIEIVRTYGPFCHLIFNRVGVFKPSTRILPFFDFYNNFIKIPDYRYLVNHDMHVKYKKVPKIVVPKYVFQKLYSYVTRGPDNSFSYERGATYFHGITSKIIIGNQVYVEDLGKLGHEYDDILFSVMCMAAQSRLRRTKNFGKFMRSIDNDFDSSSRVPFNLLSNIKLWFEKITKGDVRRGDLFNSNNSMDFMMFDFEFFENKFQNGFVDVRGMRSKIVDRFKKRKMLNEVEQKFNNQNIVGEIVSSSTESSTSSMLSDDIDSISVNDSIGTASDLISDKQSGLLTFKSVDKGDNLINQVEFDNVIGKRLVVDNFSLKIKDKDVNEKRMVENDAITYTTVNNNYEGIKQEEFNKVINDRLVVDDLSLKINDKTKVFPQSLDNIENVDDLESKSMIVEKDNLNDCVIDNIISEKLKALVDNGVCHSSEIFKLQNYHSHIACNDDLYLKIVDHEKKILLKSYDGILSRGAAKMRFMLDKYFFNWRKLKTFDVSLAPGHYANLGFKKLTGGYYKGLNHLRANKDLLKKYDKVHEYINIGDLNFQGFDLVLCDIGSEEHEVKIYDKLRNLIRVENNKVIVKFYLEHINECIKFCSHFKKVVIIKPAFSFSINREVYAICENFTINFDHSDYIKASFYSIFLSIMRAYEVYSKDVFPELPFYNIISSEKIDNIAVSQCDVDDYVNDLISSVNNGDNKDINDFIGSVINNIKDVKIDFSKVEVCVCNGPPGACKSKEIIDAVKNKDLIVVPTRELKVKYENKLKYRLDKKNVKIITMHKIFYFTHENFENIYIDEASMQILGYFALVHYFFRKAKLFLYFDSEQIGTVDFNKNFNNDQVDFEKNYDYNRNTSFRCPIDVSMCYSKPFNTINRKLFSIVKINYTDFVEKKFLRSIKMICLTQNTKMTLRNLGFNVNTVHEYQGGQDEHIVFYNDVNDLIITDRLPRHINVAMSRHSNTLIVVGQIQGNYDLCLYDSAAERMIEANGRPITSEILLNDFSEGPLERLDAIKLCKIDDKVMFDIRDKFDLNRSIDVIGKFINIYGVASTFKTIRTVELPLVKQGKASVNPDIVCKPEFVESGKYLTEFNTARAYDSKDYFTAVKTLLGRYGLKTKKFNSDEINEGVIMLEKGVNVWLKFKIDSVKFNEVMQTTQEEWSEAFIDYCFKLNAKKNLKPDSLIKDISDIEQKNGLMAIEYFMKKQDKYDVDYDMILKQKLGQGVNSWDKMMNVVFATFCRLFGRKIRMCMSDNVIFANGLSDVEIGNRIASNIVTNRKEGVRYVYAENDMEEYDTSQNEITIENEVKWLKRMGCNEFFVKIFKQHRVEWRTNYPGYCQLIGYGKKHSGEPFTLDFNTLLCMALNGLLFPLEHFVFAAFKGDDSELMSDNVKICEEGAKVCAELGFKTKLRTGECSEFIGYIVTPYGFYPDLLRVACKLLNKRIADDAEGRAYFEELKLAAHDRLQVIDCYEVRDLGRKMYMDYMNLKFEEAGRNEKLNTNDVFELESLLFNFKNIDFDSLIKRVKLHVFIN